MQKRFIILFSLLSVFAAGCNTNEKKKAELIANAYDKYHPTYGYRSELPDKQLEVNSEGESLWQRPPERVAVYKTPDGPETGGHPRAPVDQNYLGYKEGDDQLIYEDTHNVTGNLTTRQPVGELPDYLRGDYGSTTH